MLTSRTVFLGARVFLLLTLRRQTRRPSLLRKAEISPVWSISAAAATCIWSVANRKPGRHSRGRLAHYITAETQEEIAEAFERTLGCPMISAK
jgi:hypothetical protein